jgi:hypothetical protein
VVFLRIHAGKSAERTVTSGLIARNRQQATTPHINIIKIINTINNIKQKSSIIISSPPELSNHLSSVQQIKTIMSAMYRIHTIQHLVMEVVQQSIPWWYSPAQRDEFLQYALANPMQLVQTLRFTPMDECSEVWSIRERYRAYLGLAPPKGPKTKVRGPKDGRAWGERMEVLVFEGGEGLLERGVKRKREEKD